MTKTLYYLFICLSFQHLLVAQVDHYEMVISAEDNWKYVTGSQAIPQDWPSLGFDDANWSEGAGSIGYGDGDDNTIVQPTASVLSRHTFNLLDTSIISRLILNADYDDAFIAYLNGTEIARRNLEGKLYYITPLLLKRMRLKCIMEVYLSTFS